MRIERDVSLLPHTTFVIGGAASYFAKIETIEDIQEALSFAKEYSLKTFVLGGGSNTLFDDAGFDGLVLHIASAGVSFQDQGDFVLCESAAGESWERIVKESVEDRGLWGIENLSGIPGTIGGAIVQNIGAYGAAISETVAWVDVYDTVAQAMRRLNTQECAFGYRDSVFKNTEGRYIVMQAALKLSKNGMANANYKDLQNRFEGQSPTVFQMRDAVLDIRRGKFPDLSKEGSAGSFFKNPTVPLYVAQEIVDRYPGMPLFSLPESLLTKIPLAWVLDHVLSMRGESVGSARLFERQPLVIVSKRGGTFQDVLSLATQVQEKIKKEIALDIEPEVCIVRK